MLFITNESKFSSVFIFASITIWVPESVIELTHVVLLSIHLTGKIRYKKYLFICPLVLYPSLVEVVDLLSC